MGSDAFFHRAQERLYCVVGRRVLCKINAPYSICINGLSRLLNNSIFCLWDILWITFIR
jgi:hypothetical protein